MKNDKIIAPGELRRRRNEWLLDLKLELQRVLRDNGKCLGFIGGSKKTWMSFPALPGYALVLSAGDILLCSLIATHDGKEKVMMLPGKDKSVFDPEAGVSVIDLLDFVDNYPLNPFL